MPAYETVAIPYGAYWSTPFARWQKTFAHLHSIEFAAHVMGQFLKRRGLEASVFDHAVLGLTVPQTKVFWGVPWLMSRAGNHTVTGPTVMQACATSARALGIAAAEVADGNAKVSLVVACDRTSNGPVLVYPDDKAAGAAPRIENWVIDNFNQDPITQGAMIETAENVARDYGIDTAQQHDVVIQRYQQYLNALADDRAFQRRYMTLPFAVPDQRLSKTVAMLDGDEGIYESTVAGLAKLKPFQAGGTVTFGGQTHPADGNAGMVVTTSERARELSADPGIRIRILGFGQGREKAAYMPLAPIKAARNALAAAGLKISDLAAVKSHNPFVVNDIAFCRETGWPIENMNNYGCSLIFGHPQGPTGLRSIIELIEELVIRGGGRGLFHGCAAGDSGMAVVIEVAESGRS